MKKFIFALYFALSFCVFAESFSFQIFQHSKGIVEVSEEVLQVEDELLNYFFEKGKIVSNESSVVSVSKKEDEKTVSKSINNAARGFVDNFCEIHLYFDVDENAKQKDLFKKLNKVIYKISSVKNPKISEENKIIVNKPGSADSESFVKELVKEITFVLEKTKKF